MKRNKQAFTLIELLVVVLIIGILAAVAVPQYQKAVKKARFSEIVQTFGAYKKALEVRVLERGYQGTFFTAKNPTETLDIELPFDPESCEDFSCPQGACRGGTCKNSLGSWQVSCHGTYCQIRYTDINGIFGNDNE